MALTPAIPDDVTLTERGMQEGRAGKILLIACGALAHEVLALNRLNNWTHLDLQCLPAKLHLYPDQITVEVARAVTAAMSEAPSPHRSGVLWQSTHSALSSRTRRAGSLCSR